MDDSRGITQMVVQGLEAPALITIALILNAFLLGYMISSMIEMRQENEKTYSKLNTELRILQVHTQDMNAILIRNGIMKPGDMVDPTDGRNK